MSKIADKIKSINVKNEKALTIFLTSGYPNPEYFVDLAVEVSKAGADIIEIGLPFGDSLADGPVIQESYTKALEKKVNLKQTLEFIKQIKLEIDTPIILMSSSNPILHFGKDRFSTKAIESGIDGLIIPDVPIEEYDDFFTNDLIGLDKILLTTPTSTEDRIRNIDQKSSGFVYCVSVVGTTGVRKNYDSYVFDNLKRTYSLIQKNKMQIGFGVSTPENVKQFSEFCDGLIVGSAVVKSLGIDDKDYSNTLTLVRELKEACKY